jgi:hypothetical protein
MRYYQNPVKSSEVIASVGDLTVTRFYMHNPEKDFVSVRLSHPFADAVDTDLTLAQFTEFANLLQKAIPA